MLLSDSLLESAIKIARQLLYTSNVTVIAVELVGAVETRELRRRITIKARDKFLPISLLNQ